MPAEGGQHGGHIDPVSAGFIICFVVILIGQIVQHICNRFSLPYTPFLAFFGIAIGSSGMLNWPVISNWVNIAPHFIMLLFLPPIIFESAFNCDWYIFKKQMGKILILAGPLILIGAFATAWAM